MNVILCYMQTYQDESAKEIYMKFQNIIYKQRNCNNGDLNGKLVFDNTGYKKTMGNEQMEYSPMLASCLGWCGDSVVRARTYVRICLSFKVLMAHLKQYQQTCQFYMKVEIPGLKLG